VVHFLKQHWCGYMGIGLPLNRSVLAGQQGPRWSAPKDRPGAFADRPSERDARPSHRLKFGERPSGHQEPILTERALVSVVDDDESVRESLPDLLREFGYIPRAFSSAEEFLASDCVGQTRCLILDVAMPGMTGPDLQRELMRRHYELTEMRQSVPDYSNWGPWRVCSSHSATLLYSRRSTTHFKPGNTLSADIR
jgi:hypothetical protein